MRRRTLLSALLLKALLVLLAGHSFASNYTGNATGSGLLGSEPVTASVSVFAGAATSSYPFAVPPGRMGMQPDLSLTYNSGSSRQGMVGRGWDLFLPSVQRDLRYGQPSFTWTDPFTLLWEGVHLPEIRPRIKR